MAWSFKNLACGLNRQLSMVIPSVKHIRRYWINKSKCKSKSQWGTTVYTVEWLEYRVGRVLIIEWRKCSTALGKCGSSHKVKHSISVGHSFSTLYTQGIEDMSMPSQN